MQYVNLGCGVRYHPDWINIDIAPQRPDVIAHDITRGLPLSCESCDVVYHSHVFEHLRRADALPFLRECYRVLKPGGILRVATPDLERLCRLYLEKLEGALAGDPVSVHDYDWILLEMYDQTVREQGGGEMLAYLGQDPLPNEGFIYERIGEEGRHIVQALRQVGEGSDVEAPQGLQAALRLLRKIPGAVRHRLLRFLLGPERMRALQIGQFRLAGEVHHWLYDCFSLTRLMKEAGFRDPVVQSATTSQIPDWCSFHLDTLPDGTVIKPDSMYVEAIKPV